MAEKLKIDFALQPKQKQLFDMIETGRAVVLGVGGGRGSGKSTGTDMCLVLAMLQRPILACCMMRNWDQTYRYHIEPMRRDFPWLQAQLKTSMPAKLVLQANGGVSQLDFSYAENYDDVVRRFRSGNYDLIVIDQAEQFTEKEIREIRKANRSKGGMPAKIVLSFNMRGSGIQTLRKWFHLGEFNKGEDPEDYEFIRLNPWDNIEHVRASLTTDGYTEQDYYAWTDEQRKTYAAERGPYTRKLATDDEVIRQADWEGGWDSLEGAYFTNSFDQERTMLTPHMVEVLRKPWAVHWMGQDWGKSHYCATYWAFRVALSPSEGMKYLDWRLDKPINVTVIYREMVFDGLESTDAAWRMVESTPEEEKKRVRAYFLSPECVTGDPNSIGSQQSKVLRGQGLPAAVKADNDRKGGYTLMGSLFKASKGQGWGIDENGKKFQYDDAVLISSDCVQLLKAIPMLMRDPKDIDDVLKTDKSAARIEQDCSEACRYLLKSMLAPKRKSAEDEYQERMNQVSPEERMMMTFKHEMRAKARKRVFLPPSWRGNLHR